MGIFSEYISDTYRYLPDQFQGIGNCPFRVGRSGLATHSKGSKVGVSSMMSSQALCDECELAIENGDLLWINGIL